MLLQMVVIVGSQIDLKKSRRPNALEASIDRGYDAIIDFQLHSANLVCLAASSSVCDRLIQ